jgi:nitrogen fixation-related uncharacterized protein
MFVPIWLIFFASGIGIALFTLTWAVKTHQFDDQDRARYLPLEGLTAGELNNPPPIRRGVSFTGLLCIIGIGLMSIIICLIVVIRNL